MHDLIVVSLVAGIAYLVGYSKGSMDGWTEGYTAGQWLIQQAEQKVRRIK